MAKYGTFKYGTFKYGLLALKKIFDFVKNVIKLKIFTRRVKQEITNIELVVPLDWPLEKVIHKDFNQGTVTGHLTIKNGVIVKDGD